MCGSAVPPHPVQSHRLRRLHSLPRRYHRGALQSRMCRASNDVNPALDLELGHNFYHDEFLRILKNFKNSRIFINFNSPNYEFSNYGIAV
jgi:hypothetical protein